MIPTNKPTQQNPFPDGDPLTELLRDTGVGTLSEKGLPSAETLLRRAEHEHEKGMPAVDNLGEDIMRDITGFDKKPKTSTRHAKQSEPSTATNTSQPLNQLNGRRGLLWLAVAASLLICAAVVIPSTMANSGTADFERAEERANREERGRQKVLSEVQQEILKRERKANREKLVNEVSRRLQMYLTFARNKPHAGAGSQVHRDVLMFESISTKGHFFGIYPEYAASSTCQLMAAVSDLCDDSGAKTVAEAILSELDGLIGRHYGFGEVEGAQAFEADLVKLCPDWIARLKQCR